jgi:hypothetical protein
VALQWRGPPFREAARATLAACRATATRTPRMEGENTTAPRIARPSRWRGRAASQYVPCRTCACRTGASCASRSASARACCLARCPCPARRASCRSTLTTKIPASFTRSRTCRVPRRRESSPQVTRGRSVAPRRRTSTSTQRTTGGCLSRSTTTRPSLALRTLVYQLFLSRPSTFPTALFCVLRCGSGPTPAPRRCRRSPIPASAR